MKGMYNKQILLIAFLLISISYGCGVSIKSLSYIKWSGRDSGISEKVETMGYYKFFPKLPDAFIFYDDGTIVLCDGEIIKDDTTFNTMNDLITLKKSRLEMPSELYLYYLLKNNNYTNKEVLDALWELASKK